MIVIQFNRTRLGQRFLDELLPLTNLITPTPGGGARGQRKKPARKSKRPTIVVTTEEQEVNDQAVAALSQSRVIFQRGGVLVQILRADSKPSLIKRPVGSPRIVVLPSAVLREHLAAAAEWCVPGSKGKLVPTHPPVWSIKAVMHRGHWAGIRPLEGLVSGPVLRSDGTILAATGYDQGTGLFCKTSVILPEISNTPSRADIGRAVATLEDAIVDFPFETPAHKSTWYAYLLTILARPAFPGPAPLFLLDSNTPGSGKGLLCDLTSHIATGRKIPRTPNPTNDDETRKLITALAIAGDATILIDNVEGSLGSPALDAALTGETWRDRILGASQIVELPLLAIWSATGNNVVVRGDMPRRTARIRILALTENPEQRTDFRHKKLIPWAVKQRGQLLAAALTLLRGYHAAGRPDQGIAPWGSFEGWSDLVRSTVVWAGLPDPADTRQEIVRDDMGLQALGALLTGLRAFDPDGAGLTVSEIVRKIYENPNMELAEMIRDALAQLCPAKSGGAFNNNAIGMKFHHLRKRIVGGRYLDSRSRNNSSAWYVQDVVPGTTGTTGTTSSPERKRCRGDDDHQKAQKRVVKAAKTSPRSPRSPGSHCDDVEKF
jgi:hypothetical protein